MEGLRVSFIQRAWNDSERVVLQAISEEEFLHKKINNTDIYVDCGATDDSYPRRCI